MEGGGGGEKERGIKGEKGERGGGEEAKRGNTQCMYRQHTMYDWEGPPVHDLVLMLDTRIASLFLLPFSTALPYTPSTLFLSLVSPLSPFLVPFSFPSPPLPLLLSSPICPLFPSLPIFPLLLCFLGHGASQALPVRQQ